VTGSRRWCHQSRLEDAASRSGGGDAVGLLQAAGCSLSAPRCTWSVCRPELARASCEQLQADRDAGWSGTAADGGTDEPWMTPRVSADTDRFLLADTPAATAAAGRAVDTPDDTWTDWFPPGSRCDDDDDERANRRPGDTAAVDGCTVAGSCTGVGQKAPRDRWGSKT